MLERWPLCHSAVTPGQVPVAGTVDGRAIVQAACRRHIFVEREFISRPVHVIFTVD